MPFFVGGAVFPLATTAVALGLSSFIGVGFKIY